MEENGKIKGFVFALSLMELSVPGFMLLMMTPASLGLCFLMVCTLPLSAALALGFLLSRRKEKSAEDPWRAYAWMLGMPFISLAFSLWAVIPLQGWLMVFLCLWAGVLLLLDYMAFKAIRHYRSRRNVKAFSRR